MVFLGRSEGSLTYDEPLMNPKEEDISIRKTYTYQREDRF